MSRSSLKIAASVMLAKVQAKRGQLIAEYERDQQMFDQHEEKMLTDAVRTLDRAAGASPARLREMIDVQSRYRTGELYASISMEFKSPHLVTSPDPLRGMDQIDKDVALLELAVESGDQLLTVSTDGNWSRYL